MWIKYRAILFGFIEFLPSRKSLIFQCAMFIVCLLSFQEARAAVPVGLRNRHQLKQDLQSMIEDMSKEQYLTQLAPIYSSKKSEKTKDFGELLRSRMGAFQEMKNFQNEALAEEVKGEERLGQKKVFLRTANGQNCPKRGSSSLGLKIERVCLDQFRFVGPPAEVVQVKDRILGLTQHQKEKKAARSEFESYVQSQTRILSDLEKQRDGLRLKDGELSQKIDQMDDSELNDILEKLVWEYEHVKGLVRPELIARYGSLAVESVASCHSSAELGRTSSAVPELFGTVAPIALQALDPQEVHGQGVGPHSLGSGGTELPQWILKLCWERVSQFPNARELYLSCIEEALAYQSQRQSSAVLAHHVPPPLLAPSVGTGVLQGLDVEEDEMDTASSPTEEAVGVDDAESISGKGSGLGDSRLMSPSGLFSLAPPPTFSQPHFGAWPVPRGPMEGLLFFPRERSGSQSSLGEGDLMRRRASSLLRQQASYRIVRDDGRIISIQREGESTGSVYQLVPDASWNRNPEREYPKFIQEKPLGFYCDPENSNECYRVELKDGRRKTTKYIFPSSH